MSLALSHHSERALHGIDDPPPKEKRKSRLREQRDELLATLRAIVLCATQRKEFESLPGLATAIELIARIKGK